MSGIRVTYTGLIAFVSGIIAIVFGLIVTLIITRSLSPEEFGTWRLIINLLVYVVYIQPIITFWAIRESARNIATGKTAILANGFFSCIAIAIYLIIVYSISDQTDADVNIMLSAMIMIPMIFLYNLLHAVTFGWKPHAVNYGFLALEGSKIPLLLITIIWFEMGVFGIITAMTIAYVPSIVILFIYSKEKLKNELQIKFFKKWLKLFWVPLYPSFGSIVAALDVLIFSILTGSVVGLAYHGAAIIISKLCDNAILVANAVYPKLLEGKELGSLIQRNISLLSFFAIPLATGSIFFAKPAIYALNPIYVDAYPAIIFMTIRCFLFAYTVPFADFLKGIEKVDTDEKASFKDYIKSKLFLVPTVRVIQYSVYLISLIFILMIVVSGSTDVELIIYWSIVWLATEIPIFIYFYILTKKNFKFKLETKKFVKYLVASIATIGGSYLLSLEFLEFKPNILDFLPNLLLFVGLGIGGYLVLTYFIDDRTRKLVSAIINEMKNKKR